MTIDLAATDLSLAIKGFEHDDDLAATDFALAITHDLCDKSYVLSTIWTRFQHFPVAGRS